MRNEQIEGILGMYGVEYNYTDAVPWSQVDIAESRKNLARPGDALNESVVRRYAAAKRAGATFPAVVLYPLPNGKFLLLDGNHNQASDEANGVEEHDAYIVSNTLPKEVFAALGKQFNRGHGFGVTVEAFTEQALDWLRDHPLETVRLAAHYFELEEAPLQRRWRYERIKVALHDRGIDHSKISPSGFESLSALMNDLPVFYAFAKVLNDTGAKGEMVRDLSREIRSFGTEQARLAKVQDIKLRPEMKVLVDQPDQPRPARRPIRHRAFALLRQLNAHLNQHQTAAALQMRDSDQDAFRGLIHSITRQGNIIEGTSWPEA